MSETLDRIQALILRGEVEVSLHGFRELAADISFSTRLSLE
jgi:hypothetical protein